VIDCHVHIERGPYTREWINEFINQAKSREITDLYLLEHTHRFREFQECYEEVAHYSEYQNDWYKRRSGVLLQSYINLVKNYKEKPHHGINIKWGLEVCYLPGIEKIIEQLKKNNTFDFYTGSIHWLNGWGFDHKKEFWKGEIVNDVYKQYFDTEVRLIQSELFDYIAHPDSIKCFGHYPTYELDEEYEKVIHVAKSTTIQFEQSCGLYNNYGHNKIGLEENFLKKLKENGIQIITASDAHRPEDVGRNIEKALALINEA